MKRTVLIAVIVAAVTCATPVWTQGGRPDRPSGPGDPVMSSAAVVAMPPRARAISHMASALRLSKDQTAKLTKITSANEKKIRSLEQAAANASKALRASLLGSKYNAKNSRALAAKAEKAEAALISADIDEWTQIHSILTAKQAAQLQKVMMSQRQGLAGPPPGFPPNGAPTPKGAR